MIMIIKIMIMIMMSCLLLLSHGVMHSASASAADRHSSAVSVSFRTTYTISYSNIPAEELSALYDLFSTTDGDSWQWKGSSGRWNFSAAGA
jgi:hypothetical protein